MKHVSTIRKYIEEGKVTEANSALDDLLLLGPHNVEALKLRAMLLRAEGRFSDEAKIWHQILEVDREDADAINFILQQQLEDRELFYFTEDLPGGGRRFLAYPRNVIKMSVIGLFGCISFLLLSRLGENHPIVNNEALILSIFGLIVVGPWIGIIAAWVTAIKDVVIHHQAIVVSTRLNRHEYRWDDMRDVYLVYDHDLERPDLQLTLIPKDDEKPRLSINLSDHASHLRARSHLLREVTRHFQNIGYMAKTDVPPTTVRPLTF